MFSSATMVAPFCLLFLLIPIICSHNLSSDQTILLSMKKHWGNPPSLESWNSLSSPCDWPQVQCYYPATIVGLNLADINVNGTIPSTLCQLRNLARIDLSKNKLSGHIPACLYNCSSLERLDLSMNELSGTIPSELFLMQKLFYLNITSNRLFGWLPTTIQAYRLSYMDLSHNNLNGPIPYDIQFLSNLIDLDLSMNSLSGSIPRELFHMDQLISLSLSHNNLTGELPAELSSSDLQRLNLSHNQLYGVIPKRFVTLFRLSSLDLSNNQLSDGITQSLCRLRSISIVVLRLCSNKFFGKISSEFIHGATFLDICLDPSNLCSCKKNESLAACPSNLCSADSSSQSLLNCNNIKSDYNSTRTTTTTTTAKIIAEAIGCVVVEFVIFAFIARKCWKMAGGTIASRRNITLPLTDKDKEWEMISFQKLDFDKSDILSSLTDGNLIGNGGSGKVYRVVINETGDTIAVKSIWNDKKSDKRLKKEFMAEIQTLGTIRHNNIVKLLCYISCKNTQLLVYQYFENQSLDQWLHDNKRKISPLDHRLITKLDWPMRLHIAIGVAQGLCYMHHHCSPPIIHRDIKSSNILLDSKLSAKIADFGLAKMLTRSEDTETASAIVGTFGYIAPEYAYTKRVNAKSDVYSFGVVLLELTTGRKAVRPNDHMNLAGWAQIQCRETANIVDLLDDEIKESSFLDQIVAVFRLGVMCTTKTPANRPSMGDCLNILQDYLVVSLHLIQ